MTSPWLDGYASALEASRDLRGNLEHVFMAARGIDEDAAAMLAAAENPNVEGVEEWLGGFHSGLTHLVDVRRVSVS